MGTQLIGAPPKDTIETAVEAGSFKPLVRAEFSWIT